MNNLIDIWRKCQLEVPPFKFANDNVEGREHYSYKSFVDSKDFGGNSSVFQLGLIPQPYIGNLEEASVVLLLLNPGFSPGDYYAQEKCQTFKDAHIRNLRQENGRDDYPFLYLNPEFAWTAGGQWWIKKLEPIVRRLEKNKGLTYKQALQHISKNLACIELCPYFSKEYKKPKQQLASMKEALAWVKEELAERCQAGKALAIVMRQKATWNIAAGDNVVSFSAGQARGAHLTIGTEEEGSEKAGSRIYEWLAASLPNKR